MQIILESSVKMLQNLSFITNCNKILQRQNLLHEPQLRRLQWMLESSVKFVCQTHLHEVITVHKGEIQGLGK